MGAVVAMRDFMNAEEKTDEQLFAHIGGGSGITCDKLVAFLKLLPSELDLGEQRGEKLFKHLDCGDAIEKDTFLALLRLYYKVVKTTALTEILSIKSKLTRRLEPGEVLERLEGPKKEDAVNV